MATLGALIVKIGADIKDFTQGLDRVSKSTADLGKFVQTSGETVAKGLSVIGTAALGIGVNATRMAIDFESSFAGVKKTTDATNEEFKVLAQGLRDLAKEVPVSVNELNKIAETGGALGVAKESLVDFTKTIAMVATSSNLTADDAANSFARIGNVLGLTAKDFGAMGAAVIDLGNKGASTEKDITEMAQRLAGAGNAIKMSGADVLALAAAMADVGIEAEMGGSAMSKLMINIASDASAGADAVKGWADVAGMSAQKFTTAFRDDPAAAIAAFVQGLGRIKDSGGDLFKTLGDLDIKEVRLRDTVLRLAGAKDGLSKSLNNSRTAWEQNTALTTEAGKRYETSASQLTLFQNKLADTQITLGMALIPILLRLLEASEPLIAMLKTLADGFAALDPQMQTIIAGGTGLAAVLWPAIIAAKSFGGAMMALVPLVKAVWVLLLAHPFVAIGVAVAALAILIYKHWDEIGAATKKMATAFNAIIKAGLDPVISGITHFRDTVLNLLKMLIEGVRTYLVTQLTAIFDKVKQGIEDVKGYFKGLYHAVVGGSYIPDMVEEIGDHMRNLDVTMTAPARNAVVNTGRVIMDGTMTWGMAINQFASNANQTWGSISSTVAGNLAKMTDETVQWGEVLKQVGLQVLTNMITLVIGLTTQWAIGEAIRSAATGVGETTRVGMTMAGNSAIVASNGAAATASVGIWGGATAAILGFFATIGAGFAAVAGALVGAVVAVGTFIMGVLSAIATALSATIFGIPFAGAIVVGIGLIAAALVATDNLPEFKAGGIMTGPTIGKFAEGGSAEAAIPLNDRGAKFMQSAMGMGGGTQHIHLYVDGRKVTEQVVKHMPAVIHTKLGYT